MPRYLFQCNTCGHELSTQRSVDRCSSPFKHRPTDEMPNYCPGTYERVFTSPQLVTQPRHLLDENKFANGFSATDQLADRKRWDKQYEINQTPVNKGNWKPSPKSASDAD